MNNGAIIIKKLRNKIGKPQKWLAIKVNVSISTISRIESGKIPDDDLTKAIADALNINSDDLIFIFDEAREAKSEFFVYPSVLLTELDKKEQQDRLLESAAQRLADIREVIPIGLPKQGVKWATQLFQELQLGARVVRRNLDIQACWPFYELLTNSLFCQMAGYTFLLTGGKAYQKLMDIANAFDQLAQLAEHDMPISLAYSTRGQSHYILGNYSAALDYATNALQHKDLPPWHRYDLLHRKAICLAKLRESKLARETSKEIRENWEKVQSPHPLGLYSGLAVIARVEAILGSKTAWGLIEEAARIRSIDIHVSRLMEIRTVLDTMYYLHEPDKGYVEESIKEARSIAGQYDRQRTQVEDAAERVLALRGVSRPPKIFPGSPIAS